MCIGEEWKEEKWERRMERGGKRRGKFNFLQGNSNEKVLLNLSIIIFLNIHLYIFSYI